MAAMSSNFRRKVAGRKRELANVANQRDVGIVDRDGEVGLIVQIRGLRAVCCGGIAFLTRLVMGALCVGSCRAGTKCERSKNEPNRSEGALGAFHRFVLIVIRVPN